MVIALIALALESYALLDNSGLLQGKYRYGFIVWYTNLSNILVWLYFLLKVFGVNTSAIVNLTVMMAIMVTFLIYHFLLSGSDYRNWKSGKSDWNFFGLTNMSLHYICPLSTLIYWLFFTDKTGLVWSDGLYFLLCPWMYIIYIAIRKKLKISLDPHKEAYYPYEFMDVSKFGLKQVTINIVVLMIFFSILGVLAAIFGSKLG